MGIIFKKPQGGSGSGVNIGISKGQFLATENQTTFVIQNTISENDLLMIHVNNLYLEKDINYSISEDSVLKTTTITLSTLKVNDIVSWILIKVGDTPITPEIKKAICGEILCGEVLCSEGLEENIVFETTENNSSLSDEFLKTFS